jgi:anti-sigma-K factor RskA
MRYSDPALIDHLASQYVLGTLRGPARRRFEALLRDRADIRAVVMVWHARVQPLAVSVPSVRPSARLWSRIERRTSPLAQTAAGSRASLWSWLKPAALVGAGFAAAMVLMVFAPVPFMSVEKVALREHKAPQSYVGFLLSSEGNPMIAVRSLRYGEDLTIKMLKPSAPPAGSQYFLWALPTNAAPFLLAALPEDGRAVHKMKGTSEQLLSNTPRLQVTAEPAGSTPASPVGPVVMTGHCIKLWDALSAPQQ